MKKSLLIILAIAIVGFSSCGKDTETVTETVDSSQPVGTFTAAKTGTFVAQNGTPTAGTVQRGVDAAGTNFLRLGSNFTTELGTGTVTIYLSTSSTFRASPGTGNPDILLVGFVKANGVANYKLASAPAAKFTHIILWCGTASIPFGNASLL
jgi:hypothetical protein